MSGGGAGAVGTNGVRPVQPAEGAVVTPEVRKAEAKEQTPEPVDAKRPPPIGDATPRRADLDRPDAVPARDIERAALPPAVLTSMRERFGADFSRLPPAELERVTNAYNDFMRSDTGKRDVPAFLQSMGRALVADRQRVVGDMAANPTEQLVRLAPAIARQDELMRVVQSADHVDRLGDVAFTEMRNRLFTSRYRDQAVLLTPESVRTPQGWQDFRRMYSDAVGDAEVRRMMQLGVRQAPERVIGGYISAMDTLHQPNGRGAATYLGASPREVAQQATRDIVQLGRENPGLLAFTPEQVQQMASGLRVPGVQPSDPAYQAQMRARLEQPTIRRPNPDLPADLAGIRPPQLVSALTVFRDGTRSTLAGLEQAATKLRTNTMTAGDMLPLAYQMQEHLVGQLFTNGELRPGTVAALTDLSRTTTEVEQRAQRERYVRGGVAVAGVVTGLGLLASGPLGWGVGVTTSLAVGAGASAITTMALDVNEYRDRLRAGGLNQAGLVLTNLERENGAGLAASLALNAAGALGGIPAVTAAQRLQYARGLIAATRVEGDAARTAAVTQFLARNQVMSPAEWAALSPERQATALRLVERFGSEVDPGSMRSILQFGARDAEVTNGPGAVSNVDHMYAAYNEMNVAEALARGRPLTERERTVNAIATIGTDAQGKFGHNALGIIPTATPTGVARTAPEYLQGVRERAVREAFAGIDRAGPGVNRQALAAARDRYLREVAAEADPAKRNAAMAAITKDLQSDPQTAAWVNRQFAQTDYALRMQPFVEGAFVHNVNDPGRIYTMGRAAGLSEADATEAAYRATMHGFGNAFVATAYPGMPQFAGIMRPGTTTPLFSPAQLRHLDRVGRASLQYNQELQPTVAQARRWGIATDPPPRGVRQVYTAALRANGGRLPEGLQEWLVQNGAAVRQTRLDAGIGAGATNADNLGNYVPEGMRKWAGIFSQNGGTPAAQRTVGDQVERLVGGVNGYSIEEFSVGNVTRFDANFAGPAARLGLTRSPTSATYEWIMRRGANGFEVADNANPAAVRAAADAVRGRFPTYVGNDREVLRTFYNGEQAGDLQSALAVIAEGNLPAAFNYQAALRNAAPDRRLGILTQILLYQQAITQGVRSYDGR